MVLCVMTLREMSITGKQATEAAASNINEKEEAEDTTRARRDVEYWASGTREHERIRDRGVHVRLIGRVLPE
jgi:hypothetical protein